MPLAAAPLQASRQLLALSASDALQLFAATAGHVGKHTLSAHDRVAAERIIAALGYHTLAVKLAAGYTLQQHRLLDVYAAELEDDPRRALVLRNGQEAVTSVLYTTYSALPREAQNVFAALALFATNSIGRQAVSAVSRAILDRGDSDHNTSNAAERAIEELVECRLIDTEVQTTIPEGGDRERFVLHALVRAYSQQLFHNWTSTDREGATTRRSSLVCTIYRAY